MAVPCGEGGGTVIGAASAAARPTAATLDISRSPRSGCLSLHRRGEGFALALVRDEARGRHILRGYRVLEREGAGGKLDGLLHPYRIERAERQAWLRGNLGDLLNFACADVGVDVALILVDDGAGLLRIRNGV